MEFWEIWVLVSLVFFIIELFTGDFSVVCFSIGALVSAVASVLGLSFYWQFIFFILISFFSFVFIRPMLKKILGKNHSNSDIKTNMDNLIGKSACVVETIEKDGYGRVKIDGDYWKAESDNHSVIEKDKKVEVISFNSIILTVKEKK